MDMRHRHSVACLVLVAGLSLSPAAQGPPQPVTWSVTLDPNTRTHAAGGKVTALVTATIDGGWHVYSTQELPDGPRPLGIELVAGGPARAAGPMVSPEPERDFDEAFSQVTAFYTKAVTFRLPLSMATKAKPGPADIAFDISFQACDGRLCLPGRTVRVGAPVSVTRPR